MTDDFKLEIIESLDKLNEIIYRGTTTITFTDPMIDAMVNYAKENSMSFDEVVQKLGGDHRDIVEKALAPARDFVDYVTAADLTMNGRPLDLWQQSLVQMMWSNQNRRKPINPYPHTLRRFQGKQHYHMIIDEWSGLIDRHRASESVNIIGLDPEDVLILLPKTEVDVYRARYLWGIDALNCQYADSVTGVICGRSEDHDIHQHLHYGHDYQKDPYE